MKLREGSSHSFQPATGVRSSSGSHVYTFANGSADLDSSSEDEFDVAELRARGGPLPRQNASRQKVGDVVFLERAITEDDTLYKLALQYGCKVADIKRINNLIREQDMYALKTIKIPVKVHGLLTEQHEKLNLQQGVPSASVMESPEEMAFTVSESRDLSRYFQEIDQNIESATQTQDLFSEAIVPDTSKYPSSHLLREKDPSSGADWGIRWWNAVFIMLLIGIVLPVFYIIYFKTQVTPGTSSNHWNGTHITTPLNTNISSEKHEDILTLNKDVQSAYNPIDTGG
ncbi:lysM and putative peptidoglycan-binding domain-containing protein 4 [Spea bombifrons]|uniref:lysM and putative peptidoglycan-binding domain-containing protein 4 n=1 Tax=Spea bombifrons TaxID=233779 RepID=UPI00234AEF05|nr:lysM and putative peptidoglycan-binding domain-containing protein 4 [Spea bombifrons]